MKWGYFDNQRATDFSSFSIAFASRVGVQLTALPRLNLSSHIEAMNKDRLLPVLRNLSNDILSQAGVLRGVAPGLAVFLAEVSPTLKGTMGVSYVLRNHLPDKPSINELFFELAFRHLVEGMHVNLVEQSGERFHRVHRADGFGASVIALPDFYEKAASWCRTKEMFVCIEDVNHVWVGTPDSKMARQLREKTRTGLSRGAVDLDPVCLILRENGFDHVGLPAQ